MNIEDIKKNMNRDNELSEFACKNRDAIRLFDEFDDDIRPPFLHDGDKIIYSLAYTRYINKTQVYSLEDNDNITKRSTHVQMVSKIARTIGRALRLNEDLIESASLGHDLGHVPFGHCGEAILNKISLREGQGYFFHNIQSVRTLLSLDKNGQGNNLTIQVLDAIMCHNGELELECYKPKVKSKDDFLYEYNNALYIDNFNNSLIPMTLEGCVVRISDLIAYLGKDIEDALRLGKLNKEDIPGDILKYLGKTNSDIINTFVLDVIKESIGKDYIKMSKEKYELLCKLKKFNYEYIYTKANSKETLDKWDTMFNKLYYHYLDDLKVHNEESHIYTYFYKNMSEEYKINTSIQRVVLDYLAGMTDNFIYKEYDYIIKLTKTL